MKEAPKQKGIKMQESTTAIKLGEVRLFSNFNRH
jgi:hypothetical protein